ncbi:Uncharacterised protein [Klebsiella pneumoniae]|nr:Uncharacterised protein [Klebsiella pneumoniae]
MATGNARTHFHYTSKLNPLVATAKTSLVERNALPVIPTIFVDGVKTYGDRPTRRWRFCSRHHCPELNAVLGALTHNRVRTYSLIRVSTCIRWANNLQTFAAAALEVRRYNRSAAAQLLIVVIGFESTVDPRVSLNFQRIQAALKAGDASARRRNILALLRHGILK